MHTVNSVDTHVSISCRQKGKFRHLPRRLNLVVVDYGAGNLHSVVNALRYVGQWGSESELSVKVTSDPSIVARADRIVLPGVGAFAACAAGLRSREGIMEALDEAVQHRAVPFLGICVGMQLMAREGFEHGRTAGLGWIDGVVSKIPSEAIDGTSLRIPHMGWNYLSFERQHPLFAGLDSPDSSSLEKVAHAYFVHSYQMQVSHPEFCLATTFYGGKITAAVGRDTRVGVQFHPEKSQGVGLKLLENFLRWSP